MSSNVFPFHLNSLLVQNGIRIFLCKLQITEFDEKNSSMLISTCTIYRHPVTHHNSYTRATLNLHTSTSIYRQFSSWACVSR